MIYQLAVVLHLLAAIVWVGGALFLAMVMVPVSQQIASSPSQRAEILGHVARRFRTIAWVAIVLLVITGLYLAFDHWRVTLDDLIKGPGWLNGVLRVKVALVALIILLSVLHDFILGPRVTSQMEGLKGTNTRPPESLMKARRRLVTLARINVLLILIVVVLAVTLTRGSPV